MVFNYENDLNDITSNVISYGTTQNVASIYNAYGENKVTNTKVIKSYAAPI